MAQTSRGRIGPPFPYSVSRDFREISLGHRMFLFSSSPLLNTYVCFRRKNRMLFPAMNSVCTSRNLDYWVLGPIVPQTRHLGLIFRLPSLQRKNTDLNLGLRPFSRPPHGVASHQPPAIILDGIGMKVFPGVIIPNVGLMRRFAATA